MEWDFAPDIKKSVKEITKKLELTYIDTKRLGYFRSFGSTSKARARIWGLPRILQKTLNVPAHYAIEVVSERFDRLSKNEQYWILIHELLHIPSNFSGTLLPHRGRWNRVTQKRVEEFFQEFKKK